VPPCGGAPPWGIVGGHALSVGGARAGGLGGAWVVPESERVRTTP
jgi:hypothetical protein